MAENNKDSLMKSISSIRSMAVDFLSDIRNFEILLQGEDSDIKDDRFEDVSSALDECLGSISEAAESLNEAEFALAPEEE